MGSVDIRYDPHTYPRFNPDEVGYDCFNAFRPYGPTAKIRSEIDALFDGERALGGFPRRRKPNCGGGPSRRSRAG